MSFCYQWIGLRHNTMPTTYFLLTSRFSKQRYISLQKIVKCSVKNSKSWENKFGKKEKNLQRAIH